MTDTESAAIANPAPLGLLAIGLTIILLSLGLLQLFSGNPLDFTNSVVMIAGTFIGGIALLVAGIFEFKKGNTFNATVFVAYSMFWISFIAIISVVLKGTPDVPSNISFDAIGAFAILWGVVALFLFIGALKMPRVLQIIFLMLTITLFVFGASFLITGDMVETLQYVAGATGMICGIVCIYTAFAMIINDVHGKTVLPII